MGTMAFAAQYQQDPVAEDGNCVHWSWFRFYDETPQRVPGDKIVVSWDTAVSAKELANYSAAVVLQVRGKVCTSERSCGSASVSDLRRKAIELHKKWRNACDGYALLIENKGAGIAIQEFQREHIHAISINPEGEKEMRLNNNTPRIRGRLRLAAQARRMAEETRELCAFPGGRHDDQVDAFSQALTYAFRPRRKIIVGTVRGIA